MECTCWIKEERSPLPPIIGENRTLRIVKCPLCKAAPKMYEALKEAQHWFTEMNAWIPLHSKTLSEIVKALAKAEGKA
jgi:hypothetical protein